MDPLAMSQKKLCWNTPGLKQREPQRTLWIRPILPFRPTKPNPNLKTMLHRPRSDQQSAESRL
jgi:hypothetical protein